MSSFNSVNIMGRLTKAPELRYTKNSTPVCSFTIALDGYKDDTIFVDCVAWDKQGEFVSKYFPKGALILIEGRLTNRRWEKDGISRTVTEVTVKEAHFTGERRKDEPVTQGVSVKFEELTDDLGELPF